MEHYLMIGLKYFAMQTERVYQIAENVSNLKRTMIHSQQQVRQQD